MERPPRRQQLLKALGDLCITKARHGPAPHTRELEQAGLQARDQADLFAAPGAVREALPSWGGSSVEVPGAIVQAVLAQSLSLGHWLRPWSLVACTALASVNRHRKLHHFRHRKVSHPRPCLWRK